MTYGHRWPHVDRSEAERLHLQQATATLQEDRQQLSADVHKLQQQLAEAHAAYTSSQQQCQQISATKSSLQLHLTAAIREYRANDIICCGLRSQITSLQQQLSESRQMCKQQVRPWLNSCIADENSEQTFDSSRGALNL